ncbi:MAG: hypothetical protein R3B13_31675 [Polyangiaceae bacterium]
MLRLKASTLILCLGIASVGHARGVSVEDASQDQWRGAQKTFLAADELFDAQRYEEAMKAYIASWDIVASPNTRLQIARCQRELGRLPDAYDEMTGALSDAEHAAAIDKKYQRAAVAARTEREAVRKRIGLISLQLRNAPEGTLLQVGERDITLSSLDRPIAVTPGEVRIRVSSPGREDLVQTIRVEAGSADEIVLDLSSPAPATAPPTTSPPTPVKSSAPRSAAPSRNADSTAGAKTSLRPYAIAAGGVGVLGLATFAVLGSLNNSKFADLEDACNAGKCPPGSDSDIDTGRQYQTFANVGLIVGVVGIGAGVALWAAEPAEPSAEVGLGPGSVTLRGRF